MYLSYITLIELSLNLIFSFFICYFKNNVLYNTVIEKNQIFSLIYFIFILTILKN